MVGGFFLIVNQFNKSRMSGRVKSYLLDIHIGNGFCVQDIAPDGDDVIGVIVEVSVSCDVVGGWNGVFSRLIPLKFLRVGDQE